MSIVYSNFFNINNLYNINYNSNVNENIFFIEVNESEFITNSSFITSPSDGVVIEANNNRISINQNDGYILVLKGTFDVNVFSGDYVEKGSIIAMYYDSFNILFIKDNVNYDYQTYIKNTIKNNN